jgi:septum formation protein
MQMTESKANFILASASPRRRELLDQIGVRYRTIASEIDESVRPGEDPGQYVRRMALEKAMAVKQKENTRVPVLGADTAVIVDESILGKPQDREHAVEMLMNLSGRTHEVWSAVTLVRECGPAIGELSVTRVTFAPLPDAWIEAYWDSGDPLDKAGAYAVQGKAAQKISRLEGSYSGVMGLPLYETTEILRKAGLLNESGSNQQAG